MVNTIYHTKNTQTRFGEEPDYQEGLYDLGNNIYAWLVPNGSWGESNSGLIVGETESLLIDTQWDLVYTREMLEGMSAFTEKSPIKQVINTHADGDHFWGNELFPGCDIIASERTAKECDHIQPKNLKFFRFLGKCMSHIPMKKYRQAGHWFTNMVKPYDFKTISPVSPGNTFNGKFELSLNDRAIQLLEVGPTHTGGDTMVFIPDASVLFTGDVLFINSTPVSWQGPVANWLTVLDQILEMDVETIVPGHGPLCGKEEVKSVKNYWRFLLPRIEACFQRGLSPVKAAREIALSRDFLDSPFVGWKSPERIMTNAHTIYRNLAGNTKKQSVPAIIKMMFQQALLAHEIPNCQPSIMTLNL